MTGLENILAQIKLDCDATAERILSEGRNEASKLESRAKAQVERIQADGQARSAKAVEDIISRANSSAQLENGRILLQGKQEVIAEMISSAYKAIKTLPEEQYFSLIYKMISKYSSASDGVLSLNAHDLARVPDGFEEKASSFSKGKITLSNTPSDIDGGFILTYGGVDVNCSLKALFDDNSEKITDAVAKLLFG